MIAMPMKMQMRYRDRGILLSPVFFQIYIYGHISYLLLLIATTF